MYHFVNPSSRSASSSGAFSPASAGAVVSVGGRPVGFVTPGGSVSPMTPPGAAVVPMGAYGHAVITPPRITPPSTPYVSPVLLASMGLPVPTPHVIPAHAVAIPPASRHVRFASTPAFAPAPVSSTRGGSTMRAGVMIVTKSPQGGFEVLLTVSSTGSFTFMSVPVGPMQTAYDVIHIYDQRTRSRLAHSGVHAVQDFDMTFTDANGVTYVMRVIYVRSMRVTALNQSGRTQFVRIPIANYHFGHQIVSSGRYRVSTYATSETYVMLSHLVNDIRSAGLY